MKRNGFDREMCGDYFQYVHLSFFNIPHEIQAHTNTGLCGTCFDPLQCSTRQTVFTNMDFLNRAYRDCKKNWVSQLLTESTPFRLHL